ncbi:MAG TPA: ABC transporter permease [Gemmatimonadaceae bacterium]|nr:ABC transporter permease [Gemmatimonadaceae bacterium]
MGVTSARRLVRRLVRAIFRRRVDRELDDELRFHLEMQTGKNIERGMRPDDARVLAERELGRVDRHKDDVRALAGRPLLAGLGWDARFAVRVLRRSPAFTLVAVLTLALGIGATTAIFTVVDVVLLRPLDYPEAERLVTLRERTTRGQSLVSYPNLRDWRERSRSFEAIASFRGGPSTIIGGSEPVRADAVAVSGDFFGVLRARAAAGRALQPEDDALGAEPVAVVSHAFWQRYLGGRADLETARLQLWSTVYSVVGVMPPTFDYPEGAHVWFPLTPYNQEMGRTSHNDVTIARLRRGVTVEQARRELDAIAGDLAREHAGNNDAVGAVAVGLQEDSVGGVRTWLVLLLGAVGFVLLVACVNLASANLARGAARMREMAVRTALGAGRWRLVRQLLTENILLALVGGVSGVVLAQWLVRALLALQPGALPMARDIAIDFRVVVFAALLSLVTGVVIGILPALQLSGDGIRAAMADGGRGTVGVGRGWMRHGLVAAEVALALVLLVGAGLLIRSLRTLLRESTGFDARGVLVADVTLPDTKYPTGGSVGAYYDRALESLRSIPGAGSVAMMNIVPLTRSGFGGLLEVDVPGGDRAYADYRVVSPEYFRALRIPLLSGRMFDERDDSTSTHVTLVNRAMAEQFWPGEDAVGKRVRSLGMDRHRELWLTVIGVVADVKSGSLARPAGPQHYVYYRQRPERALAGTLIVRAPPGAPIAAAVRERLTSVDRDVPVELAMMSDVVGRSVADRRFITLVLTGFGGVALLLAAIGVYGVLSYWVARRTQEIGVRVALGARRGSVVKLVLVESMTPVILGIVAGVLGALAATRLLRALLYGVSDTDPSTFVIAATLVVGVGVLASCLPAWRAARVDPVVALRGDG